MISVEEKKETKKKITFRNTTINYWTVKISLQLTKVLSSSQIIEE